MNYPEMGCNFYRIFIKSISIPCSYFYHCVILQNNIFWIVKLRNKGGNIVSSVLFYELNEIELQPCAIVFSLLRHNLGVNQVNMINNV